MRIKNTEPKMQYNEKILEDDYPVYAGYFYVADGKVIESPVEGTVRRLKIAVRASEIRSCDIFRRELLGSYK